MEVLAWRTPLMTVAGARQVAGGDQWGPRYRSPLKWIRWVGASATQTSVSQAISARYRVINPREGNAVTNTRPAVELENSDTNSAWRLPLTGPWLVTDSMRSSQLRRSEEHT